MVNPLVYLVNLVYYCAVKSKAMAETENKTTPKTIVQGILGCLCGVFWV